MATSAMLPMQKNVFFEYLQKNIFSTSELTGNRSNAMACRSWSQPFWTSTTDILLPQRAELSANRTLPIPASQSFVKAVGILLPEPSGRSLCAALSQMKAISAGSDCIRTTVMAETLSHVKSGQTSEARMIRTGMVAICNQITGYFRKFSHQDSPVIKNEFTSHWCAWSNALKPALWLASWKNIKSEFEKSYLVAEPKQYCEPVRRRRLLSGACCIPHPDKRITGGRGDAHFICDDRAVGVADGLAHPRTIGDDGQYAKMLMHYSLSAAYDEPNRRSINAMNVLEKAYYNTEVSGSSTACIVALHDQGRIHAVNIGDSGFIIIRDGRIIFRSSIQQHRFNVPYQLHADDAGDLPSSAAQFIFPVDTGDIIVTATDGLFDNLYMEEIVTIVVYSLKGRLGPRAMARQLAGLAHQRVHNSIRESPFSITAQAAGYQYRGGKPDDITVVISFVTAL